MLKIVLGVCLLTTFAVIAEARNVREPIGKPSEEPTDEPTEEPTEKPTDKPTVPPDDPELNPSSFTSAIFKDRTPICAGTIVECTVNTVYIATAAHCVYKAPNSRLFVSLGNAVFDFKKVEPVHQVIVHPYYSPPSLDYDIAILKIKPTAKINQDLRSLSSSSALKLTKVEPESKDSLNVVNWDFKADNASLTIGNATFEDRKSCRTKLGNGILLSKKTMCANYQSIVPDGGPLIFKNGLVGVASYGTKGNKGTSPVVFTNIANSEIYSFIEKYI